MILPRTHVENFGVKKNYLPNGFHKIFLTWKNITWNLATRQFTVVSLPANLAMFPDLLPPTCSIKHGHNGKPGTTDHIQWCICMDARWTSGGMAHLIFLRLWISVQQLLNAWYLAVLVMVLEFRKPPNSWHSSLLLKVHCEVVGQLYEPEKYVSPKLPNLDHLWSVTANYFFESYTTCPPNNKVRDNFYMVWQYCTASNKCWGQKRGCCLPGSTKWR